MNDQQTENSLKDTLGEVRIRIGIIEGKVGLLIGFLVAGGITAAAVVGAIAYLISTLFSLNQETTKLSRQIDDMKASLNEMAEAAVKDAVSKQMASVPDRGKWIGERAPISVPEPVNSGDEKDNYTRGDCPPGSYITGIMTVHNNGAHREGHGIDWISISCAEVGLR